MRPLGSRMLGGVGEEAPWQQGDPTPAQPMPPVGCSHGPLQLLVLDGAVQRLRREEWGQLGSRARLRGAAQSRGSTEGFGTPRPICPGRSPSFLAAVLLTAWPVCTHQLAGIVSGLQVPSPGHLQPQARLGHSPEAQHRLPALSSPPVPARDNGTELREFHPTAPSPQESCLSPRQGEPGCPEGQLSGDVGHRRAGLWAGTATLCVCPWVGEMPACSRAPGALLHPAAHSLLPGCPSGWLQPALPPKHPKPPPWPQPSQGSARQGPAPRFSREKGKVHVQRDSLGPRSQSLCPVRAGCEPQALSPAPQHGRLGGGFPAALTQRSRSRSGTGLEGFILGGK